MLQCTEQFSDTLLCSCLAASHGAEAGLQASQTANLLTTLPMWEDHGS